MVRPQSSRKRQISPKAPVLMINRAISLSSFAIDLIYGVSLFANRSLPDSRQSGQTVQVWVGKTPKTVKHPQSFVTPSFPSDRPRRSTRNGVNRHVRRLLLKVVMECTGLPQDDPNTFSSR